MGEIMTKLSFRHSVIPSFFSGLLMLAFSGCNQAPRVETAKEPTLTISPLQSTFRKGQEFRVAIKVYSPKDSNVNVLLAASKNLGLDQEQLQTSMFAGQTKTFELRGMPKRSGYYNITANATSSQWQEPATDMLGFNVATNNLSAANATEFPQTNTRPSAF
jgi:hypothetical protein